MATKSEGPVDRVVMVPRKADGTPAIDNYEIIGDKSFAIAAAAEQLGQNAVSTADHERARAQAAGTAEPTGESDEDRIARHRDLMASAARQAAGEVEAAHSGEPDATPPLERSVPVDQATSSTRARKSSS